MNERRAVGEERRLMHLVPALAVSLMKSKTSLCSQTNSILSFTFISISTAITKNEVPEDKKSKDFEAAKR